MSKNISLRKQKRLGTVEPSEMDYARLAAYIDGEGCISVGASRKKTWKNESVYVNLSVHNTDARLIDWCAERWGGRVYKTVQTNSKWTDSFGWRVSCQQARQILECCLPYFIKREQAEIAIALQKTQRRWGRNGAPLEVHALRQQMRNKLSELKGKNARMKRKDPESLDQAYLAKERYGVIH